jgi:hypothetical protein
VLGPALGNIRVDDWGRGRDARGPSCNVVSSGSGAVNSRGFAVFESGGHKLHDSDMMGHAVDSGHGSGCDMVDLRHPAAPAFKSGGVPMASEGGIGLECGGVVGGVAARDRVGVGVPRRQWEGHQVIRRCCESEIVNNVLVLLSQVLSSLSTSLSFSCSVSSLASSL